MHVRTLVRLCLASAGWAFAFGLGSQVTTHWLKHAGASDTVVGLNHGYYYLGVALGSLLAPALTRRLGPAGAAWGMLVSGLTLALFPWAGGPWGWFALRLGNGIASALSLVPLETLVSRDSAPALRTRNFAYYAVALTLGGALGIDVGMRCYRPGSPLAFYLGAALPAVAAVAVASLPRRLAGLDGSNPANAAPPTHRRWLGYGTAWCQGFLEGGMLAFLSLYLLGRGLAPEAAGDLMGVTLVGVILFQVPAGWLADRWGPLPILLGCYAVVIVGLAGVPFCQGPASLAALLFLFGACSGAMYPLGLSLLGDATTEDHLARAYAGYLAMECVGSQLGAAAMGRARDAWGEGAMFGVGLAAVLAVLATWVAASAFTRRRSAALADRRGRQAA